MKEIYVVSDQVAFADRDAAERHAEQASGLVQQVRLYESDEEPQLVRWHVVEVRIFKAGSRIQEPEVRDFAQWEYRRIQPRFLSPQPTVRVEDADVNRDSRWAKRGCVTVTAEGSDREACVAAVQQRAEELAAQWRETVHTLDVDALVARWILADYRKKLYNQEKHLTGCPDAKVTMNGIEAIRMYDTGITGVEIDATISCLHDHAEEWVYSEMGTFPELLQNLIEYADRETAARLATEYKQRVAASS